MISRTSNELPCFVILDDGFYWKVRIEMADGVRFELTQDCSWPVFKTRKKKKASNKLIVRRRDGKAIK